MGIYKRVNWKYKFKLSLVLRKAFKTLNVGPKMPDLAILFLFQGLTLSKTMSVFKTSTLKFIKTQFHANIYIYIYIYICIRAKILNVNG